MKTRNEELEELILENELLLESQLIHCDNAQDIWSLIGQRVKLMQEKQRIENLSRHN